MFGDVPAPEWADFQVFKGDLVNAMGTGQNTVRTYQVPDQASMLYMIAIGGGGFGGNGATGAAGTARGGGAGGGSGGITRLIIPAKVLPRTLYIRPGQGGINGINSSSSTLITVNPQLGGSANANDIVILANSGGNGTNGTTGAAAAGAAGTAGAAANWNFGNLGIWNAIAGQAGAAGGNSSGAAGSAVTWGGAVIIPISGGAGGGGVTTTNVDQAGGAITGTTVGTQAPLMPTVAAGVAAAGRGNNGMNFFYNGGAFRTTGGSGGGTAGAAGTAGAGGNGGYGSGGGGGGGGVTGGAGGNAGPGIVFIWAW